MFRAKPSGCVGCPLESKGKSFVPSISPPQPRAILLGQAPGEQEALTGQPFVGRSGEKLNRWLELAQWEGHRLHRDECYVGNAIWCWYRVKGKDPDPPPKAVAHCRAAHWGPEVEKWVAEGVPVLALGVPALRAIGGPKLGERDVGAHLRVEWGHQHSDKVSE